MTKQPTRKLFVIRTRRGKHRTMKTLLALLLVTYVTAAPNYDCSYGESYWCSNLNIAKKCGAVQHCMDTVWRHHDLSDMKDAGTGTCLICQIVMKELKQLLLSNSSQAQIEQFLNEACGLIPDQSLADECKQELDENIEQVFNMIRESLDPKAVCSTIGLCPGFKDLVRHHKEENQLHFVPLQKTDVKIKSKVTGDVCKDCKAFIGDLRDMIDSNTTEVEIEDEIKKALCPEFGQYEDECNAAVESYLPEIMALIAQSVDPDTFCQAMGVCTGDKFILQKMRLQKAKITKAKKLQTGELCPICEMAFQELKSLLSEDTIQKDVENFIKKNLCSKLGSYQQTCEQDVDTYGAILFEMVTSEVDPTTICTTLGLCGQKKTLQNVKQSVECVLCEFIMKEVDQQIGDNATEAEIIKALDEVCNVLPDTISQQCKQFIDTYGKAILIILKETMDPQSVCTSLGLCQGTNIKVPVKSVGDGELCAVCETVIQYVDSLLEENATVAEIEAALNKVCNFLPDTIKGQCNDFVKQYGPMIIQLILEAANPEKVCKELKLCTSTLLPVIEPMLVPLKAQLVGVNECTYGPSYWCSSYENAKKCKATQHCTKHVWKNGAPRL